MTWSQVHPGLLDRLEMTEEFDMLVRQAAVIAELQQQQVSCLKPHITIYSSPGMPAAISTA